MQLSNDACFKFWFPNDSVAVIMHTYLNTATLNVGMAVSPGHSEHLLLSPSYEIHHWMFVNAKHEEDQLVWAAYAYRLV